MRYRAMELSLLSLSIHYRRWQLEIYKGMQSCLCILSVDDSFFFTAELKSVTSIYRMVYCIRKQNVQEIKFLVLNCCKILMTALTADTVGNASGSILDSLNLQSRSLFWYKGLLCSYKILHFEILHSYTPSPPQNKNI